MSDCPCCHEPITNGNVTLNCTHQLCVQCFTKWARLNNTCPCCREVFAEKPKVAPTTKVLTEQTIKTMVDQHIAEPLDENETLFFQISLIVDRSKFSDRKKLYKYYVQQHITKMVQSISQWYEN